MTTPPPPFSTVTEAIAWYVGSLNNVNQSAREEHARFFSAGLVAGHTTTLLAGRDVALQALEEVRSWTREQRRVDGALHEMFRHWRKINSRRCLPRDHELHAFYCGAAALVSLLNRGGEAGLPALQREIMALTPEVEAGRPVRTSRKKMH